MTCCDDNQPAAEYAMETVVIILRDINCDAIECMLDYPEPDGCLQEANDVLQKFRL